MNTTSAWTDSTARPHAAEQASVAWFWLSCAALSLLALWPLATTLYPGMPDYPNHLARAQLIVNDHLHGREHPYYQLRHVLIPNLALDTLVPLFVHWGMDVNDAMKLFAGFALLLPVAGVIAIARVLHGGTPWLALLAFPLAFSRYYAWGFLNYYFALGLALLAFGGWLRLRTRQPMLAGVALALAGALTLVSHLVGFGVLALLVLAQEGWLGWRQWRARQRLDVRSALPALLALAACGAFYLLAFERGLALDVAWLDGPLRKLRNMTSPFIAYETGPAVVVAVLVIGTFALLRWRRRIALQAGWLPPVAALLLAFLLLPTVIMNSYFASARLFVVAALVFLAFATLRGDARLQITVALVALLATAIKTADVRASWAIQSPRLAELRQGLTALPEGARLYTAITVANHRGADIYPLRHVGAFAIIDRQAFIPYFFGFPFNGEAVAFRPEVQPLRRMLADDLTIFQSDEPIRWDLVCRHFDAVLMVEQGRRVEMPACARPLRRGDGWGLYRLVR